MPKKKVETKPLLFVAGCGAKYMDENGQHKVKPGDIVEFTPAMYEFHKNEAVWVDPPKAEKAGE